MCRSGRAGWEASDGRRCEEIFAETLGKHVLSRDRRRIGLCRGALARSNFPGAQVSEGRDGSMQQALHDYVA